MDPNPDPLNDQDQTKGVLRICAHFATNDCKLKLDLPLMFYDAVFPSGGEKIFQHCSSLARGIDSLQVPYHMDPESSHHFDTYVDLDPDSDPLFLEKYY